MSSIVKTAVRRSSTSSVRVAITAAVSLFALSATAHAQETPPADPTAPTPPANAAQCSQTMLSVSCPAGLDADGFNSNDSGLTVTLQDGSFLGGTLDVDEAGNSVTVSTTGAIVASGRAIDLGANAGLVNNGSLFSTGDDGVRVGSNSTITNNGIIFTDNDEAIEAADEDNVTIINNGVIFASGDGDKGIEGNANLTITNTGMIVSIVSEAIEADAGGLVLNNSGQILSFLDDGVDGDDNVTIVNSGLIQGGENDGLELNNGTITNSGTIISLSSDPNGSLVIGGTVPELDAAIDFDAGTNGNEDGIVFNLAGGLIEGDIGIVASPGNQDSPDTNDGAQQIFNNGTITGRMGDAALLGNGNDLFVQQETGVQNGVVNGEAGIDTLAFGNTGTGAFSIDLALFSDTNRFRNFENFGFMGTGAVTATGTSSLQLNVFSGALNLGGTVTNNVTVADDASLTVQTGGSITNAGGAGVTMGSNSTVTVSQGGSVTGTGGIIGGDGAQTVVNGGAIAGTVGLAVALGGGADSYTHNAMATIAGGVSLGAGGDSFVLAGTASSIGGGVDGGEGTDNATIGGTYNADILTGFESTTFSGARIVGARSVTGDVTFAGTNTFDLNVDRLAITGNATVSQGAVFSILTTTNINSLPLATPITVFSQTGTFTNAGGTVNINDDDLLVDYTFNFASLTVTANAVNPGAGSTDLNTRVLGQNVSAAFQIRTLAPTVATAINALPDTAAFEQVANQLLPSLNESISREIFESSNLASRFLDDRLASDEDTRSGIWGQFGYRSAEGDARSATVTGYEADNLVFTLGADTNIGGVTLGIAGTYADIDIDDQSASLEEIDISSYKIVGYGGFEFLEGGFLNGEIGYLWADVDTARTSPFGAITGDFDVEGFVSRAVLGYGFQTGGGLTVTPSAGLNYAYLDFDDYSETGGFGFGVNRDEVQFFEGRLALAVAGDFNGIRPQLTGAYVYDFDADERVLSLTDIGTPSFVVGSAPPSEDRFEVDASVGFALGETTMVLIGYNGEFAEDYDSHGGVVRVRFGF